VLDFFGCVEFRHTQSFDQLIVAVIASFVKTFAQFADEFIHHWNICFFMQLRDSRAISGVQRHPKSFILLNLQLFQVTSSSVRICRAGVSQDWTNVHFVNGKFGMDRNMAEFSKKRVKSCYGLFRFRNIVVNCCY
jgi:hypothetical protein